MKPMEAHQNQYRINLFKEDINLVNVHGTVTSSKIKIVTVNRNPAIVAYM
jgi:hypothetical protein